MAMNYTWRVCFWKSNRNLGCVYVRACCRADALAQGISEWVEIQGRPMVKDIRVAKL